MNSTEITKIRGAELLNLSIVAALEAGQAILEIYNTEFEITVKEDRSPLTLADQMSHNIISGHLEKTHIPILSEEGKHLPYEKRKSWDTLWIVDPLDGTKEFIKKNGEFTVNIALVTKSLPVMGVIYVPVKDLLYFAAEHLGAYRISGLKNAGGLENLSPGKDVEKKQAVLIENSDTLPLAQKTDNIYRIVGSRSHPSPDFKKFVEKIKQVEPEVELTPAGSSLKFCIVAEGKVQVYPRLGPTMEWDTAAGQAIASFSGRRVEEYEKGSLLRYNKPDLLNPWFIVK